MPSSRKKNKPHTKKRGIGHANSSKKHQQGQLRIIGGILRGRKISILDKEGLRPTTDRVRETLFNWLINPNYIRDTHILDMYAGTGVLGFESISRGAKKATFFEFNKEAFLNLKKTSESLKISNKTNVKHIDAILALSKNSEQFDVVFIDPPFGFDLVNLSIKTLEETGSLVDGGLVYVESEASYKLEINENFKIIKELKTKTFRANLLMFQK